MKKLYISFGCGLWMALAACSEQVDTPRIESPITLQASVGDIESLSRATAQPFRGETPTEDQPLSATVWFSLNPEQYAMDNETSSGTFPCRSEVSFKDATPQTIMNGNVVLNYPSDNTPVYCVGFYPSQGWSSTDGQVATHGIDGEKDLMFASKIEGSWNSHFSGQKYKHLLTWLKINVCAADVDAADIWGNIEKITITSKSEVNVPLNGGEISYSGEVQSIPVFEATPENPKPLKRTMQEVGSVLCSSPKGTGSSDSPNCYVVRIQTSKVEEKVLLVNLPEDAGEPTGKLYILTFYFQPYAVVESACTLATWDAQNEDLYPDSETPSN